MNDRTISITVHTDDVGALTRAADMLHGMANDVSHGGVDAPVGVIDDVAPIAPVVPDAPVEAAVATPTPPAEVVVPDAPVAVPEGAELDAEGMPHDTRIHSNTKNKTKAGLWKKTRGVDKQLVKDVTAELKAAMSASPDAPITPDAPVTRMPKAEKPAAPTPPAPAPAPVTVAATYTMNGVAYTADQLLVAGWKQNQIDGLTPDATSAPTAASVSDTPAPVVVENSAAPSISFPQIMQKITAALNAGSITDAQVQAAVNAQGLASVVLLSARADLIDNVHAAIFPNG